jgi:site-specific recombinase XerD
MSAEQLVPAGLRVAGLPVGLGAAADRFARTTLRKSAQTQRTYASAYTRFTSWLAARTNQEDPPLAAFTADALAAYLDELERDKAPATVKKERAALNRLARYLHTLGAIDATEILLVETAGLNDTRSSRDALDATTYERVKTLARARLVRSARMRSARPTAARDLALILVLGEMDLRSHEARSLLVSSIAAKRVDGLRLWLTVVGKGEKVRRLPIPTDVHEALLGWQRQRPAELASDALLFPRLGRPRHDGSFPDTGGQLSGQGLSEIVKPIMLGAGVEPALAHPHVLRHTYGSLFMRNGGELSKLQALMGHASSETTSLYVHTRATVLRRRSPPTRPVAACWKPTPTTAADVSPKPRRATGCATGSRAPTSRESRRHAGGGCKVTLLASTSCRRRCRASSEVGGAPLHDVRFGDASHATGRLAALPRGPGGRFTIASAGPLPAVALVVRLTRPTSREPPDGRHRRSAGLRAPWWRRECGNCF